MADAPKLRQNRAGQQAQAYPDLADVFVQMDDAYRAFVYGKDHPELAILPKEDAA